MCTLAKLYASAVVYENEKMPIFENIAAMFFRTHCTEILAQLGVRIQAQCNVPLKTASFALP